MRQIVCEECGKHYDFEKEDFCPKCGAFNQPVRVWGTDAQGNVIRVDGVNEANHQGSFAHSEVHKEKWVRRATGMDWKGQNKKRPPARPADRRAPQSPKTPQRPQAQRKKDSMWIIKTIFIVIAVVTLLSWIIPFFLLLI